jgi:hypothetical protein
LFIRLLRVSFSFFTSCHCNLCLWLPFDFVSVLWLLFYPRFAFLCVDLLRSFPFGSCFSAWHSIN